MADDEYVQKLEETIAKMRTSFIAMKQSNAARDNAMHALKQHTLDQATQIEEFEIKLKLSDTTIQELNQNARALSLQDIESLKSVNNGAETHKLVRIVREKSDVAHKLQGKLLQKDKELEVLKRTAQLTDKQLSEMETLKQKVALIDTMEIALEASRTRDDAVKAQLGEFETMKQELKAIKAELSETQLEADRTTQNLTEQLDDMKNSMVSAQAHASEVIVLKDRALQVKDRKLEAAALRDEIRVKQETELQQLQHQFALTRTEHEDLKSRLKSAEDKLLKQKVVAGVHEVGGQVVVDRLKTKISELESAVIHAQNELDVKEVVARRNKEMIASLKMEVDAGKARDGIVRSLQENMSTLGSQAVVLKYTITELKATIRDKEDEIRKVWTTQNFKILTEKAHAKKTLDAHTTRVASLKLTILNIEADITTLTAEINKRDDIIELQKLYQKELLGAPMDDEAKRAAYTVVHERMIQMVRDYGNCVLNIDVPWTVAKATCESILEVIFQRVQNGTKILLALNFALNKGPFWEQPTLQKNGDEITLETMIVSLSRCKIVEVDGEGCGTNDREIVEYAQTITSIVKNGNPDVIRSFFEDFDDHRIRLNGQTLGGMSRERVPFASLHLLAEVFQVVNRAVVRRPLAKIFRELIRFSHKIHHVLQQRTPLPMELARDVKERSINGQVLWNTCTKEQQKELVEALELTIILLAYGEKLPMMDFEYMDSKFVNSLLDLTQGDAQDQYHLHIQTLALEVLLGFNLQFNSKNVVLANHQRRLSDVKRKSFSENFVLVALQERLQNSHLAETLLQMANRSTDPLVSEGDPPKQSSVLKMLGDVFSNETLARNLFHSQDLSLLVKSVCVREIKDLPVDDMRRLQYIDLLANILKNSDYLTFDPDLQSDEVEPLLQYVIQEGPSEGDDVMNQCIRHAKVALDHYTSAMCAF